MDNARFNEVVTAIRAGGGTVISAAGASPVRFYVDCDSLLPFQLEKTVGKPIHYEGEDTRHSPFAGSEIITEKIRGEWVRREVPHAGFIRTRIFSVAL